MKYLLVMLKRYLLLYTISVGNKIGRGIIIMAYRELSKVLSEIGLDIAGKYNCYSLDYQTMKENEYVINFQGEEDRDRYKDNWTKDDNGYFFAVHQTLQGCTVQYPLAEVFSQVCDANAPVQVFYTRNGIVEMQIYDLFTFHQTDEPLVLKSFDEVADTVAYAIYLYARVPFMERWQMYQVIRLGRQKWIGIQIFKIFAAAFLYTATVLVSGVLIMVPHLEWTADWGRLYHTLALTNLQDEIDLDFFASYRLINDYKPARLMLISALVLFLVVSFIGLIMLLISLCFSRAASVITATSLAIAEIAIENAGRRMQQIMVYIIPTEWIKIAKAGTKNVMGVLSPDFDEIIIRLFIMVLILMVLIYLVGSRVSYNFYGEE